MCYHSFKEVRRLFRVLFYKKANGESPVLDYVRKLEASKGKDSRIRSERIAAHLRTLSEQGTAGGMPYMRHLDGDIWELRPTSDRILFAYAFENAFVLLHYFVKKTQKTPRQEIERARRELQDFLNRRDYYEWDGY